MLCDETPPSRKLPNRRDEGRLPPGRQPSRAKGFGVLAGDQPANKRHPCGEWGAGSCSALGATGIPNQLNSRCPAWLPQGNFWSWDNFCRWRSSTAILWDKTASPFKCKAAKCFQHFLPTARLRFLAWTNSTSAKLSGEGMLKGRDQWPAQRSQT
jgi:hypothetical protein